MKKVAFYTLGCKLNFSETSSIGRMFEERGYAKVDFTDRPDIFIINTCSVTDNADKKCRKIVREAKAISPDSYIAIIGCYAQLKPTEISEIEGVDAVLGASEKFRLLELLDDFKKGATKVLASDIKEANTFNAAYSINDRTRTFLKVQDGCDYSCTFCTIPLARGNSRSDTIANIVAEAIKIGQSGIKEVVLTGVNTGDFGIQNGKRKEYFIDLIKALDQVEEINRFRISSIEPNLLTNEIIEFVANSKRFAPHFHIPLQSGSDDMLKQMKRRYLSDLYTSKAAKIRSLMPYASIGVDVIIGFPGETDELFKTTYQYLTDLDISYLHVFTYSERPNTPAASMANAVPMNIRNQRSKQLRNLSEKKKRKFYAENVSREATVLFENDVESGLIQGFTENYIRVVTPFEEGKINQLASVKMTKLNFEGLMEVEEMNPAGFANLHS
ncbi:MAG: tRNA (N(6)-L-threonylcarbamoyladenosine(37)-C(2))-methylthiotransferase MtaB [Cyclobacteriaceae bacterium]|nr:tRNA (N(6)-L-threonylcarbamoyladenosine(37)-C(2))-methylthiotransferase MtaB [Cyclobacteriaceae bacterium]